MNQKPNNPYEKLLDYLVQQETKSKKKTPIVKKEKKAENLETTDTKKLIEESKIFAYIPGETFEKPPPKKSDGFDVAKFESLMRAKLIEEYKKLQSYERPYISVSELYTCFRQCFYVRMRYPVNFKKLYEYPYLYLIQKMGNEIHKTIQELYEFSETEKTIVSEKFKVKGRLDGIRDSFLFEIKTIDVDKFKNEYIKEHYLQGIIYAYILNTEYQYNIKTITIIYVIRNCKKIVPFDLPVDHKLAESLLSRSLILKSSIETSQVPDPFGATKETCKYCLYRKQCEDDICKEVLQPFKRKKKPDIKPKKQNDHKTAFIL